MSRPATSSVVRAALALLSTLAVPAAAQDSAALAERALAAGRAWQAFQLLRPVVADHARAAPAIRLLAGRAAAAWGGWTDVTRVLTTSGWDSPRDAAAARELLARAALARRADAEAADHLRAALPLDRDDRVRGTRHVLLARAHDRLGRHDSAATHYREAADLLPEAAEWLWLRAAEGTADSGARRRLFERIRAPLPRARVATAEARARTRAGDLTGATIHWQLAGAPVEALRARLAVRGPAAAYDQARADLLALIATPLGAADGRAAIALLDSQPTAPTTAEQLVVARRAAALGDQPRAIRGFAPAGDALAPQDRLRYGTALAQVGRHAEAIAQFDRVGAGPWAGQAAYQRARSVLARSGGSGAIPALEAVPRIAPADTASAGVALFLAGDLLADRGDLAAARQRYARVAREYPTSAHAPRALLEVGTIAWTQGDVEAALQSFDVLATRYPDREEGTAGAYWAGRAAERTGRGDRGRARWQAIIARTPHSFYALAAARRLGQAPWAPDTAGTIGPAPPGAVAALARAALLDSLGLDAEATAELDALGAPADTSTDALVAAAGALARAGHRARATVLAQRALARGAPRTLALYRLLFPIPEPGLFQDITAERRLDPWLVAGLIKQESGFNPRARSAADARGLMQVLPSVGTQLARQLGWGGWDPVLLYQPEVSLQLGTLHLREMIRRYPEPVRFLAAYNAGAVRVARWDQRPGVLDDPELYLERIPYLETRNYVRRVLRNAAFYEAIHAPAARGQQE